MASTTRQEKDVDDDVRCLLRSLSSYFAPYIYYTNYLYLSIYFLPLLILTDDVTLQEQKITTEQNRSELEITRYTNKNHAKHVIHTMQNMYSQTLLSFAILCLKKFHKKKFSFHLLTSFLKVKCKINVPIYLHYIAQFHVRNVQVHPFIIFNRSSVMWW